MWRYSLVTKTIKNRDNILLLLYLWLKIIVSWSANTMMNEEVCTLWADVSAPSSKAD